jgi:hypothetical protein
MAILEMQWYMRRVLAISGAAEREAERREAAERRAAEDGMSRGTDDEKDGDDGIDPGDDDMKFLNSFQR